MTPIFPRAWMVLLVAALACLPQVPSTGADPAPACRSILGGTLAASGCEAWTATFDQGGDDQANGLVMSPDGTRLYLLSAALYSPNGPEIHLQAYSTDGEPLWTSTSHQSDDFVPNSVFVSARSIALSPDGDHIYITGSLAIPGRTQAYLLAYSADGAREWSVSLEPGTTGESIATSHDGSTIYLAGGGHRDLLAAAFDARTSATMWRAAYDGGAQISSQWKESGFGAALSPDGAALYVTGTSAASDGNLEQVVLAYDASMGATRWITRFHGTHPLTGTVLGTEGYMVLPSPEGSLVYVHGTAGTRALDAATGAGRWSADTAPCRSYYPLFAPSECSLALDAGRDRIFALGYNDVAAYDARTGTQLWHLPLHLGSDTNSVTRAMVLGPDGSHLYLATPAGKGYVTDATLDWTYETHSLDASSGRLVWRTTYGEHAGTRAIAISPDGGRVYVTGEHHPRTGTADVVTIAYDTQLGLDNVPKLPLS